jgi:hypothetical protein
MKVKLIFLLLMSIPVLLFAQANGQNTQAQPKAANEALWANEDELTSGVGQIREIMVQLAEGVSAFPPGVERVAVYNIQVDRNHFPPGVARYIRFQIEAVLRKYSRRQVVAAPNLKTMRINVSDTSFSMTSRLPDAEQLWDLGRSLGIDAFLQGTCTKSEDGDVILSVKLIKQETAEILWTGNYIAGPNEDDGDTFGKPELVVNAAFSYWDLSRYTVNGSAVSLDMQMYHYYLEAGAQEAVGVDKRVYLGLYAGLGMYLPVSETPEDTVYQNISSKGQISAGPEILLVLVPKEESAEGYLLGSYVGVRAYFPSRFIVVQGGLQSRMTPHFAISMGISYFPFFRPFAKTLPILLRKIQCEEFA